MLVHRTELLEHGQERLPTFYCTGNGVVGTFSGGRAVPTGRMRMALMRSLSRMGAICPLV